MSLSEFTRCPKLPDFTLQENKRLSADGQNNAQSYTTMRVMVTMRFNIDLKQDLENGRTAYSMNSIADYYTSLKGQPAVLPELLISHSSKVMQKVILNKILKPNPNG
ncbi:MAG: hypothetical protein AB2693_19500 [Candidatus Thiodiazotropha sp.]